MDYADLIEQFHLFRTNKTTREQLVKAIARWQRGLPPTYWKNGIGFNCRCLMRPFIESAQ